MKQNLEKSHGRLAGVERKLTLFKSVVHAANDGIMITDAGDSTHGPRILYVNESFCRITGYSRSELVGKSPRILQGEGTDREQLKQIRESLVVRRQVTLEILNYRKDGTAFWNALDIFPVFDNSGKLVNFASTTEDATLRKSFEHQLLAAKEQADKANAAKSEFLANMSHELRTPMNGIIGLSEFLSETELSPNQIEMTEAILGSAKSLLVLLNDILDFSKLEAGELKLESSPFFIKDELQSVLQLLSPLASKKGLNLSFDCSVTVPPVVVGDALRLKQIITNIVGNGIKFTHSGFVRLSVGAEPAAEQGACIFTFSVEDTGIGISPDVQDKLFRKFYQGDASTARLYGGTGLGLAISYQLASLMGGAISLSSAVTKGSTFRVSIPFKKSDARNLSRNASFTEITPLSREMFASLSTLVVDDHPVNMMVTTMLLQKFGFMRIDRAPSGADALRLSEQTGYDLIFLDCQMPELDGFEVSRRIRAREQRSGLERAVIIALTANAMAKDREACLMAGMDDYISKPISREKLHSIVSQWVLNEGAGRSSRGGNGSSRRADEDFLNNTDILRLFVETNRSQLDLLANHISTGADKRAWRDAAHRLHGSSAQLGANTLSRLCKEAEVNPDMDLKAKQALLDQIIGAFAEIESRLAALTTS